MPLPDTSVPALHRQQLRRELRAARRSLSVFQQKIAAAQLTRRLGKLPALQTARHIALYWPMDGEIDPRRLPRDGRFAAHRFYLPVLRAFPALTLRFVRWHPGMPLHRNRFGIPEPAGRRTLPARNLDAILLPLTGFDDHGNRLGMGGGFYDRTLSFRRRGGRKPLLIGVAHACQQVASLPVAAWDVPLGMIATDRRAFRPVR
jgi:5-formyltetrahydrofolate cyclo-ligase